MYDLKEIKEIRKKLGLTQTDLAKYAKVSQSLIAKIEANMIDPTYSKVVKIFNAFESLSKKKDLQAKDIMKKKLISVSGELNIKEAIKQMKRYDISQMPVMNKDQCEGIVTESLILDSIIEGKKEFIKDIMGSIPPIVDSNTNIEVVSNLLKFYQLILVSENGKIKGIITKADVLNKI